jgi:class 3 adenylate cyclase/pimeloyl-ACP methyl ester carboxylesterase
MEPRIQYAKTSDGVSIAYYTMGEGIPLVTIPLWFSSVTGNWNDARDFYNGMSDQKRLVSYDNRGTGMSQRQVDDVSIEAFERDLEAVVDELGLGSFALFAPNVSAAIAINYVVRRPDRVSHLILWCPVARASDMLETSQVRGMTAMLENDWELFTELVAQLVYGFAGGETSRRFAANLRESVEPDMARLIMDGGRDVDVSDLLPKVSVPTLVMHRRAMTVPALDVSRTIAASIPGARLALVEGGSMLPHLEDADAVLAAVDEFLGVESRRTTAAGSSREAGALVTVLFTDVEGSTALTDRLGDAKARELLREHERITRDALKAHGGSEVKTMGDGFLASFSSATKALECAIAIQSSFAERNESAEEPIKVRIGLNAGEPIAEDDPSGRGDLFGTAVNIAARIAAKAEAGEILASNVVRELVAGKEFLFSDRGETELRGFEDPVRVYEVRWRESD